MTSSTVLVHQAVSAQDIRAPPPVALDLANPEHLTNSQVGAMCQYLGRISKTSKRATFSHGYPRMLGPISELPEGLLPGDA